MGLLYEELTYEIRKCLFDVHNAFGGAFDEESYHVALTHRLRKSYIPFESKVARFIRHRGVKIQHFIADLIVDEKVILELKFLQGDFHPANYAQILGYLKCWNIELGMLVNFGQAKVDTKRVVFTEKELVVVEDYQNIETFINSDNRIYLRKLRTAILEIGEIYNLGYRDSIYQSLIEAELAYYKVPFSSSNSIPVCYEEQVIRRFELKYPIIANRIICGVVAHKKGLEADIFKMKTYLNSANLKIGILVHFGKDKMEIVGVAP